MNLANALPTPGVLEIHEPTVSERWKEWKERFQHYLVAAKLKNEEDEVKVSTLLTLIGADAHRIYTTFTWTAPDDKQKLDEVLKKFDEYCNPRKNTIFERFRFNSRQQQGGESLDQFVSSLRQLAANCDFENVTPDQLLCDRIVFGIADAKVRERLLRESDLTLTKCLDICRACEVSSVQMREVSKMHEMTISAIGSGGEGLLLRTEPLKVCQIEQC